MQMRTGVVRLHLLLRAVEAKKKSGFHHISSHISNMISGFSTVHRSYIRRHSQLFVFVLLCVCMKQRDLYNLC